VGDSIRRCHFFIPNHTTIVQTSTRRVLPYDGSAFVCCRLEEHPQRESRLVPECRRPGSRTPGRGIRFLPVSEQSRAIAWLRHHPDSRILDIRDDGETHREERLYARYDTARVGATLYNPLNKTFYTYDYSTSVASKTAYIRDNKLGGAYVWALNDDDPNRSTTKTIEAGLKYSKLEKSP
jgi:hypothetical protein